MSRTERFEQPDIDAVLEAERQVTHPIGTPVVKQVLELPPAAQQRYEGIVND